MVYGVNPTTIKVVWRYVQPSLEEEPLQGYKVNIILTANSFRYVKQK